VVGCFEDRAMLIARAGHGGVDVIRKELLLLIGQTEAVTQLSGVS
jgi:hypothetical protein